MDVDRLVVRKTLHQLLRILERLLKRVRVGPREVGRICWLEVVERVREFDRKVVIIAPRKRPLAPLPLHGVWRDPVDGSQTHLVKFALCGHSSDVKCERLAVLDTLHAEIEPSVKVALVLVREPIPTHPASECVYGAVLCWVALAQVARVKLGGDNDAPWQIPGVLLRLSLVHCDPVVEDI